jgi:translocation and assembly module TamB
MQSGLFATMTFGRKAKWTALALAGVGALAIGIVWNQRKPIARDMLDSILAENGVQARYEIEAIETRRQRLENVVLGDPARPDLTADWVEIDVGPSLSGLSVKAVRAGGVRLRGRLIDGQLRFGALDRLLPEPTGEPFRFPEIDLSLEDARLALETPYGPVGARIDGAGSLTGGFEGKLALAAPRLAAKGCAALGTTAYGDFSIVGRRPTYEGPVRATGVSCGGVNAGSVALTLDASASERFDRWSGDAKLLAETMRAGGYAARRVALETNFSGDRALTGGKASIAALALSGSAFSTGRASGDGSYRFGFDKAGGVIVQSDGGFALTDATPSGAMLAGMAAYGEAGSGTPVAPLAKALAGAVARLKQGSAVRARYDLEHRGGKGSVMLSDLSAQSRSGARLAMTGERPVTIRWPWAIELAGAARLGGGGFPSALVQFARDPGRIAGTATVAPYAAGTARLAATPVRFDMARGGLSLDTVATLDGPLGTGRVAGLRVPVTLRPGVPPLAGCMTPSFRSLDLAGLRLAPGQLRTCISGKEARIAAPRLAGRLGQSPIMLSAASARVGFERGDFAVDALAVRLNGGAEAPTMLDVGRLDGSFSSGGAGGGFAGASGQIGAVPLRASDGAGRWRLDKGLLTVAGGLRVADTAPDPRFNPVVADDFALRLLDGRVTATATAREPRTGTAVSGIAIEHLLGPGTGHATLDVPGLRFDQRLQPEMLTSITLGVIANVVGSMRGRGDIRWSPQGVTSTGGFRTDGLNLAAAFGPVTGLKGEIALSDLLGLETPASQRLSIGSINPGIAVIDGEVTYRLLPGLRAQIEGGRWPFAGGSLILEPTTLDLSTEAERRLTFRVEGLDAAKFIAQLEFDNIAATGTFDGVLPMIFDKDGGRIEGGALVARGDGTLSYIGELSNENIGLMGKFAFDALKSMKYERLTIGLEGPLDGDVVTRVAFKGVNQMPLAAGRTRLPIPVKIVGLDGFPFIFNITITAPFRRLFQMARTIQDPSLLVEQLQPGLERAGPAKTLPPDERPVQTPESRK